MTIRTWAAARLPALSAVAAVTPEQMLAAGREGLAHLFLVAVDAAWGLFGARIPFITISTRTALAVLRQQQGGAPAPAAFLLLGVFLEAIDPGHLQSAMIDDACRCLISLAHSAPDVAAKALP